MNFLRQNWWWMKWPLGAIGWYIGWLALPALAYQYIPLVAPYVAGVWHILAGGTLVFFFAQWLRELDFSVLYGPAILILMVGITGYSLYQAQNIDPVKELTNWEEMATIMGYPSNTPKPEWMWEISEIVRRSMRPFPAVGNRPGREECVETMSLSIQKNDIVAFRRNHATCVAVYDAFRMGQLDTMMEIFPASIWYVWLLAVVSTIIAIWVVRTFEGIGKLTGTIIWCGAAFWLITTLEVPNEATQVAWNLWYSGITIRTLELILGFTGVFWTATAMSISQETTHYSRIWRVVIRILIVVIGTTIAISLNGTFQAVLINNAVIESRGLITADMAYRLFQTALQAGTTITAIASTGLLLANAALAAPRD